MTKPMPAIFFGHGNPMNALARNAWTDGWARIGEEISRPRAAVCVSAHWYVPATRVTAMPFPRTIHDFGGFPKELHEVLVSRRAPAVIYPRCPGRSFSGTSTQCVPR